MLISVFLFQKLILTTALQFVMQKKMIIIIMIIIIYMSLVLVDHIFYIFLLKCLPLSGRLLI